MISHAFVHPGMLADNFAWPEYLSYIGAGYLSVLVFFCISGYVIGLNYDRQEFSIKNYLKKRAVRLYPIYLFSIVLCLFITGGVSFFVLSGNIFFLQNDMPYGHFKIPVYFNFVTWSLNYEALYYLLFIAIFYLRPKVWVLLSAVVVINILLFRANLPWLFIASYTNGLCFWMAGLLITWVFFNSGTQKASAVPLLSLLFLHLCMNYLGLGEVILHVINLYPKSNINWLFDLPFCIMVIGVLTGKDNRFFRINKLLSYILPACVFAFLILHNRLFEDIRWIMCIIFWVLSLVFYFENRISAFLLNKLTFFGKISYAIYLLHVPIAYLIKKLVFISNRNIEIPVKYFLWIFITLSLSILLELTVQPAVKKYFFAN